MKNIKSIGLIVVVALSFVFLSFSSNSELYGNSYVVKQESFKNQKNKDGVITVVIVRAVVYTTRSLVFTPAQMELTVVTSAKNIDKHSSKYYVKVKKLKLIKMNNLG